MDMDDIKKALFEKLKSSDDENLLELAIRHLTIFVGANFVGIKVKIESEDILADFPPKILNEMAIQELSFCLNIPYSNLRLIEHLWFAKIMLDAIETDEFKALLWKFRLSFIWSSILMDREIHLKQRMEELANSIYNFSHNAPKKIFLEFLLERAHSQINNFEFSDAKKTIDEAIQTAGIENIDFSGALGRRTQFQQKSLPQLTLQMVLASSNVGEESDECQPSDLPRNCTNGDDTLLEDIVFDEEKEHKQLNKHQTACLLAMAILERHTNTFMRELGHETTTVFLDEVIRQKCCWAVQVRALIERSRMEMRNSRRVERASAQLEEITHTLNDLINESSSHRFELIYASSPIPFWQVEKLQAEVLLSLGCISDALRIYEQLHCWEDVIKCYIGIGQTEKAESLVRMLLTKKEDPMFYCLLGDITNNAEYYQRAIEMSGDASAKASASLGRLMLSRREYSDAANHYKRSLEIQPLQLGIWFNLGYCAMKSGDYQTSIQAFHRCVSLEPDHFEAWNNLAASYIHLNQKVRAQKILKEALKLSWENPRVWENLLLVSTDIGDFKQAISAIEKLMDLEQKRPLDELPLEIISTELINNIEQGNDGIDELKKSLLGILARANSRQSLRPKLLTLYASLKKPSKESGNRTAWSAYIQLLERAYQKYFEEITNSKDQSRYVELLQQLSFMIGELEIYWTLQKLQRQKFIQLQMRIRPTISFMEQELGLNYNAELDQMLKNTRNLMNC